MNKHLAWVKPEPVVYSALQSAVQLSKNYDCPKDTFIRFLDYIYHDWSDKNKVKFTHLLEQEDYYLLKNLEAVFAEQQ